LGLFTKSKTNSSYDNPSQVRTQIASAKENWIGKVFIFLAIVFAILCVIVVFVPKFKERSKQSE
jgi:hypothetical protein